MSEWNWEGRRTFTLVSAEEESNIFKELKTLSLFSKDIRPLLNLYLNSGVCYFGVCLIQGEAYPKTPHETKFLFGQQNEHMKINIKEFKKIEYYSPFNEKEK